MPSDKKKTTKKTTKKSVKKSVSVQAAGVPAPKHQAQQPAKKTTRKKTAPTGTNLVPEQTSAPENMMPQPPATEPTPAPLETVAGVQSSPIAPKKGPWLQLIVGAVIAIVAIESVLVVKTKVDQQRVLQPIKVIGTRGGPPDKEGKYWGPNIIRVDRGRNRVMLVDSGFKKVLFWDTQTGVLLKEITAADAQNEKFEPYSADLDKDGNSYILDRNQSEVFVFDNKFKLVRHWLAAYPKEIAVGEKGTVYISNSVKNQIDEYTPEGQPIGSFGQGEMSNPGKMKVDSQGNLYLVALADEKVKVFNSKGKLKTAFALKLKPFGLPVPDVLGDKLYICEHNNQKVQVYTLGGKLLWDVPASYPATIGVDNDGVIYLSGGAGVHQYTIIKKR